MFEKYSEIFNLTRDFNNAIKNNDVEAVKAMFVEEPFPDPNVAIASVAPVLLAAQNEQWEMVEFLFELGVDLDVQTEPYKWTLLHECVVKAPYYLLDSVANYSKLNAQTYKGETPLMIAVRDFKSESIDCLLSKEKIEIDREDKKKNTALHYAAIHENNEAFLKLLAKGANLFKKNEDGETAIDLIKDEAFRLSLPNQLEDISEKSSYNPSFTSEIVKKEKEKPQEVVKKEVGLSSIKKKIS